MQPTAKEFVYPIDTESSAIVNMRTGHRWLGWTQFGNPKIREVSDNLENLLEIITKLEDLSSCPGTKYV